MMGIFSDLFGGGGGFSSAFGTQAGDPGRVIPRAPAIPDTIQPSAAQVQQAKRQVKQRASYLGRTRGGTLLNRVRQSAPVTETLLRRAE